MLGRDVYHSTAIDAGLCLQAQHILERKNKISLLSQMV